MCENYYYSLLFCFFGGLAVLATDPQEFLNYHGGGELLTGIGASAPSPLDPNFWGLNNGKEPTTPLSLFTSFLVKLIY